MQSIGRPITLDVSALLFGVFAAGRGSSRPKPAKKGSMRILLTLTQLGVTLAAAVAGANASAQTILTVSTWLPHAHTVSETQRNGASNVDIRRRMR